MSKINDGGPAFPTNPGSPTVSPDYPGMTLRDWFAGHAPDNQVEFLSVEQAALFVGLRAPDVDDIDGLVGLSNAVRAKLAYLHADAMLAARSKGDA